MIYRKGRKGRKEDKKAFALFAFFAVRYLPERDLVLGLRTELYGLSVRL
jgi:hypothetical protein